MSSGNAMSVVFGGGGKRLLLGAGAGAGAAGAGAAGAALGAVVVWQTPQLQCGQTHSTVQPRTQCSLVAGHTISLWTVRTLQWQSQLSLPGSHAGALPLAHGAQLSQLSQRSQRRVTPGMHRSLQVQQYLWDVSVLVVQVGWQMGSIRQPQRGQQWQQLSQPQLQPALQPASGQQAASGPQASAPKAKFCPINELALNAASPIIPRRYRFTFYVSCLMRWIIRPSG
jgi:hypothetical protein